MGERAADGTPLRHWGVWAYPFFFDRDELSNARAAARWSPWETRLRDEPVPGRPNDSLTSVAGDALFFVPHVGKILFPTLEGEPQGERGVVRLTYALDGPLAVTIAGRGGGARVEMQIQWVDAWLFPAPFSTASGAAGRESIGFLATKVSIGPEATWPDVLRLQMCLKNVLPPRVEQRPAPLVVGGRGTTVADLLDVLLDSLLTPGSAAALDQPRGESVRRRTEDRRARTYAGTQRAVMFTQLAHDKTAAPIDSAFPHLRSQLLFESTIGRPAEGTWLPATEMVQQLEATRTVAYWDTWSGLFHNDVFSIVADEDDFVATWTARSAETTYLAIVIFEMYVAMALEMLAAHAISDVPDLRTRLTQAAEAIEDLAEFHNRYMFERVTVHVVGLWIHEVVKRALHTPELYASLEAELSRLASLYQARAQRLTDDRLAVLTYGLIPAAFLGTAAGLAALPAPVIATAATATAAVIATLTGARWATLRWRSRLR